MSQCDANSRSFETYRPNGPDAVVPEGHDGPLYGPDEAGEYEREHRQPEDVAPMEAVGDGDNLCDHKSQCDRDCKPPGEADDLGKPGACDVGPPDEVGQPVNSPGHLDQDKRDDVRGHHDDKIGHRAELREEKLKAPVPIRARDVLLIVRGMPRLPELDV